MLQWQCDRLKTLPHLKDIAFFPFIIKKGIIMKLTKLICLLLALTCFLCCFVACDNDESGIDDGGDRVGDSWEGVDFGGSTLKISVSANQDSEVTFPACDIYTKGPDAVTTEEVQKKVLARNKRVADMLNLNVVYTTTDLPYNEVLGNIEQLVRGAAEDAPDIYNNDMYGLTRAMVAGYLWNVKNPGADANGNEVKNYFDFTYDGWNYEFMKGCTFDQNKMYILAGDYFLDMIRMAWVFYVNVDMFNENGQALGYGDINAFYEYVTSGIWDYESLTYMCKRVWQDNGTERDKTDKKDGRIGLAVNHVSDWIFVSSSGVTPFYQDENYKPCVMQDTNTFNLMATALRTVVSGSVDVASSTLTGDGIYFEREVLSSTNYFFDGNFLFAVSVLGELESTAMRGVEFQKGLVPFPKWNEQRQDEYHTMVHDQTELGAILNNAASFGRASAYMQAVNEESADVVYEYYEKGLKFKYNEDKGIRSMIDLVYNTIDTPFGMQLAGLASANSTETLVGMGKAAVMDTVASTFGSEKIAYETALKATLESFAKLQ